MRWLAAGLLVVGACLMLVARLPEAGLAPSASEQTAAEVPLPAGPWGQLVCSRVVLTPPDQLLPPMPAADQPPRWAFPDTTRHELADLLASLELPDPVFAAALDATRFEPGIRGFITRPGPDLIQQLDPASRRSLYRVLAQDPLNRDQVNAVRFWADSIEQWLEEAAVPHSARPLLRPLIYREGDMLFCADARTLLGLVQSPQAQGRLWQALAREATLRVRLVVEAGEDVTELAAYWGGGDGSSHAAGILRDLAAQPGGGSVDIAELLPPFARQRLYQYPAPERALPEGFSRDCHWSALNFFNTDPDDRFADAAAVAETFEQDFVPVESPTFGDLVVFICDGEIYHSAVWVAADIVFTRNGPRPSRPWMLLPLAAMDDFYPKSSPIRRQYLRHRRRP